MSPLSEIPVNQLPRDKTLGAEYLVSENAKPTAHPLKGESAVMPQPRTKDLSSNEVANRQRRSAERHPHLPYRSRPRPVRPQLKTSFSKVGLASNKRLGWEGSNSGIKPKCYNSSIPSPKAGAAPLNHYRAQPFQGFGHSMTSDYGATNYSPFYVSPQRLDGLSMSGPAYPGRTTHRGLLLSNHQPAVDLQEDIPTCKKLDDDEGQLIKPAFRHSLSTPAILSSDDNAPSLQASETFQKSSRLIPSVCSDADTIRCPPNQLISRLPSPKPAVQTSVSYYDYSEPFHEATAMADCKSPAAYSRPPICHAPKPDGSEVAQNQNGAYRQIRWPLENQLVRDVGDTGWKRSNLRNKDTALPSHAERGLGSSLSSTSSQRRHYVSQSYRPSFNLDSPSCSTGEKRLSMASLRLDFSFPIHPANSTNLSDDIHGLGHNTLSRCSAPVQTSVPSIPTRFSEKQWTENAIPPRTCPDQTMELFDGLLAQQSQLTKNQLCTDFQTATVAKLQNVERPVHVDFIKNAVTSVLNGNDFSRSVPEPEQETELTVDIYEEDFNNPMSVLDDSPSKTSDQTPVRKLPKNSSRYREKGTQTSPSTSRSATPIEIVKGTNRTPGASTQKDCGPNYGEVQPNTTVKACEVTPRLFAALEVETERSLPLGDSSILRQSPGISSHLPQITGTDACRNKEIPSSTDPRTPNDIDSTSKQTTTRMLQLTPKGPLAVMEQDQGPGPSIREPSPENPGLNHHTGEAFIRPSKLRKSSRSHQPESPNTKFRLSGHSSPMRDESNTGATRLSQLDSTSHRRLKLPNWTRYSQPEHTIQDGSSELSSGNEPRQGDLASPLPTIDSIDTPGISSIFSDDSSFRPQRRLKKLIISLAAILADPRALLKWFPHDSQHSSPRSSESTDIGNDVTRRPSTVNNTGGSKLQSIKRRSISKTKDLWRRCSLHERRLGHNPQVLRNTY